MNNELLTMCKETVETSFKLLSWCLCGDIVKSTKTTGHNSRSLGWDSNSRLHEYVTKMLAVEVRCRSFKANSEF